jgi:hypothetical protein
VALANLHRSMRPLAAGVEPTPPSLDEVNLALKHSQATNCTRCASWLAGIQRGVSGQRTIMAQQTAQAEAQAAQEAADADLRRRSPERYIATTRQRRALAEYHARRTQRPH